MGHSGRLEDPANTRPSQLTTEASAMVARGTVGTYIVLDNFNGCYTTKKMCDDFTEMGPEKREVLLAWDAVTLYCCPGAPLRKLSSGPQQEEGGTAEQALRAAGDSAQAVQGAVGKRVRRT